MVDGVVEGWGEPVSEATRNAITGLSRMLGHSLEVTSLHLQQVTMDDVRARFGESDELLVGVSITVSGAASGHMMLLYDRPLAFAFADLAIGLPIGSTAEMGELEASALGEAGNITGAFFVNTLADAMGIKLWISPPEVQIETVDTLLRPLEEDLVLLTDDPYLIECTFGLAEHGIEGRFLVMPSEDLCRVLEERLVGSEVPAWRREQTA